MERHNEQKSHKRRTYFIERSFQAKFILRFCALVFLGGLLTVGILYLWAMHSTTVSIIDSRVVVRTTADFMLPLLIQSVLIVTVLVSIATIIVTLFVSHKIAGPLYRFKKTMHALGDGDFANDFKIRRLDQLQDLADAFNNMIASIRSKLTLLKADIRGFKERLEGISEGEVPEQKRSYLSELKRISAELNKIISYFKT